MRIVSLLAGPVGVLVVAAALSCGDDDTAGTTADSTTSASVGASGGAGGSAGSCTPQCPSSYPQNGTPCDGSLNCGYGVQQCACTNGEWQCLCCSMANCPGIAPTPGTPCGSYMGAADCWYDVSETCSCPDGFWTCSC
jgi:hypothetical protein